MARRRRKNSNPPPYKRGEKWVGNINFRGRQFHVGSFDTPEQWHLARAAKLIKLHEAHERELDGEGQTMTIAEFAGPGEDKWPLSHRRGRRDSTLRTHAYCIRGFIDEYGDRLLRGGIGRREARQIAERYNSAAKLSSIRAMYNDAIEDELCDRNPFAALRLPQKPGRRDIDVLTPDEIDLLCRIPMWVWPDEFGRVMSAFIRWQAETCMRPGETCGLTWEDVHFERNRIAVRRSRNSRGEDTDPKVEKTLIALPPRAKEAVLAMPRLSEHFLFTNQRGNRLLKVTLAGYWDKIRPLFTTQLPQGHWLRHRIKAGGNYDLYELRHFGATWLLEDPPYGLGLKPSDVAQQLGHLDGGVRVMQLYGHPSARRARQRITEAYEREWEQRSSTDHDDQAGEQP